MSEPRNLIARDCPIPRGTVLEVEVVTTYLVPVEDVWDDEDPITLDYAERALGKWETDRARELARNYDQGDGPSLAEWRIAGMPDARFENEYERQKRDGRVMQFGKEATYVEIPEPKKEPT